MPKQTWTEIFGSYFGTIETTKMLFWNYLTFIPAWEWQIYKILANHIDYLFSFQLNSILEKSLFIGPNSNSCLNCVSWLLFKCASIERNTVNELYKQPFQIFTDKERTIKDLQRQLMKIQHPTTTSKSVLTSWMVSQIVF